MPRSAPCKPRGPRGNRATAFRRALPPARAGSSVLRLVALVAHARVGEASLLQHAPADGIDIEHRPWRTEPPGAAIGLVIGAVVLRQRAVKPGRAQADLALCFALTGELVLLRLGGTEVRARPLRRRAAAEQHHQDEWSGRALHFRS